MQSKKSLAAFIFLYTTLCTFTLADDLNHGDIYLSGHTRIALLQQLHGFHPSKVSHSYTVLEKNEYKKTFANARHQIEKILKNLDSHRKQTRDQQVTFITQQLINIPYMQMNGMGEGDWQPTSQVYKPGAAHVKQNPVYRLDGLNCQTFVQVVMALLHSNNVSQFDRNYLKISYGAAGNPLGEIVHYYNRNNFVDADFNPVNQHNGWLVDATSNGVLAPYSKTIYANITRQKWFSYQQQNLAENVLVLNHSIGQAMAKRFTTVYSTLNFPHFDSEHLAISYIPKESLAIRQTDGSFKPNQQLLDKIPTPSVAEIVRDVKKWNLYGIKIKDIIGSELTISHIGLLYRQTFHDGDLIYYKTSCAYENQSYKVCKVTPVRCEKHQCHELMFSHATDAFPSRYFWYKNLNKNYTCSPQRPQPGIPYTSCNRVVSLPFFAYLTDYQLGSYWNMDIPSIIGLHIEKLT
ncbi:MAG: DUF1460 domain-containing protein [Gammaproteobacteria bacterium]|nr:DUF1460 domain-containing protein [Gammaproteobacteria bacterium]MCW5582737.1 DUF1460 domain-containing protein [Gammaproteobacteria bacterium]